MEDVGFDRVLFRAVSWALGPAGLRTRSDLERAASAAGAAARTPSPRDRRLWAEEKLRERTAAAAAAAEERREERKRAAAEEERKKKAGARGTGKPAGEAKARPGPRAVKATRAAGRPRPPGRKWTGA